MTYDTFLRASLPSLGYNWERFRSRRIQRRLAGAMRAAGARSWEELHRLRFEPCALPILRRCLTVTISRFWRNRAVFRDLERAVMPDLLEQEGRNEPLIVWCAGCASGQEAYSVAMLVASSVATEGAPHDVRIVGSDIDGEALSRGLRDEWTPGELKEVPADVGSRAFLHAGDTVVLAPTIRAKVTLVQASLFDEPPVSAAHLILCRTTIMTYLHGWQREAAMNRIVSVLRPGGWLVLGRREHLPARWTGRWGLVPRGRQIYRRGPNS